MRAVNLERPVCEICWDSYVDSDEDEDGDDFSWLSTTSVRWGSSEPLDRHLWMLLLSLVPNITKLMLKLRPYSHCQRDFAPPDTPSFHAAGISFTNLRILDIQNPAYDGSFIDLGSPMLEDLLLVAPYLQGLKISRCGIDITWVTAMENPDLQPRLADLRRVDMVLESIDHDAADMSFLQYWMARCSNLVRLDLYGRRVRSSGVLVQDIIKALHPVGPTLKEMSLYFYYPFSGFCEAGCLSPFTCLDTVHIGTNFLCEWPEDSGCVNNLASILPRTVKRLTLHTDRHDCQVWRHALDLAGYLQESWHLKRLRIMIDDHHWDSGIPRDDDACIAAGWKIKQAYAGTKVRVYICFEHDSVIFTEAGTLCEDDGADDSVYFSWSTDDDVYVDESESEE